MKIQLALAAAVAFIGSAAYVVFKDNDGTPVQGSTPQAQISETECELVNDGKLRPISQVQFSASYPEPFDGIAGVRLAGGLQDSCDQLLQAGLAVSSIRGERVNVTNVPSIMLDTQHVSQYTKIVSLSGSIENPFDGIEADAFIELHASSPATHSTIEYIRAGFKYHDLMTLEEWGAQMAEHFGEPSGGVLELGRFYWVLSRDGLDTRGPRDVCNTNIAEYDANGWVELPEVMDIVPQHDGNECRVLLIASLSEPVDGATRATQTTLHMIDYASIAANRRAELAHVYELRDASE